MNLESELRNFLDTPNKMKNNVKTFSNILNNNGYARYTDEERSLCQSIHFKSPACYCFMKETLGFPLPSYSSLYRWRPIKHVVPGFNLKNLKEIKFKIDELDSVSRNVTLVFDEIIVKKNLKYNIYHDQIEGFEDDGNTRSDKLAKHVLVFMVRGIFKNFKFVLNYFTSSNVYQGRKIKEIILKNIDLLTQIGLNVRAIVCDQGSNNRTAIENLKSDASNFFFWVETSGIKKKVYIVYDICHGIKNLRNSNRKYNFYDSALNTTGRNNLICSWKIFEELFHIDQNPSNVTRTNIKLTRSHIYPNNLGEKMRVKLATQIYSATNAAAIRTYEKLNMFSEEVMQYASRAADFIDEINKLFDALNSKLFKNPNVFNSALCSLNPPRIHLEKMKNYLGNIHVGTDNKHYWKDGIIQTIDSIISLYDDFSSEFNMKFLLTSRFNQDVIENLFAFVRSHGGYNSYPSIFEFNFIMSKIMSMRLSFKFNSCNCESDDDFYFLVDSDSNSKTNNSVDCVLSSHTNNNNNDGSSEVNSDLNDDSWVEFFEISSEDFDQIEFENASDITSRRYFSGYVLSKFFSKIECSRCRDRFVGENMRVKDDSEIFINFRNFSHGSDFGSLYNPSDLFFDLFNSILNVFRDIFFKTPHITKLKHTILEKFLTLYESSFSAILNKDEQCFQHVLNMLNFTIIVLIRKHCVFKMDREKVNNSVASQLNKML